jgi:phosphinothricin acetyltransferase
MEFTAINRVNFSKIAIIYREGLKTGFATFETNVPDWDSWNKSHLDHSIGDHAGKR